MSGTRVHERIMQTLRPRHVVARLSPNRKFRSNENEPRFDVRIDPASL